MGKFGPTWLFPVLLLFRGISEYYHNRRNHIFRKLQKLPVAAAVFQNIANITGSDSQTLGCCHRVLRRDQAVLHSQEKISRPWFSGRKSSLLISILPFLNIGAENQHHVCLRDKRLVVTGLCKSILKLLIRHINNRVKLLISGRRRLTGGFQNQLLFFLGYRLTGKCPHRFPLKQRPDHRIFVFYLFLFHFFSSLLSGMM